MYRSYVDASCESGTDRFEHKMGQYPPPPPPTHTHTHTSSHPYPAEFSVWLSFDDVKTRLDNQRPLHLRSRLRPLPDGLLSRQTWLLALRLPIKGKTGCCWQLHEGISPGRTEKNPAVNWKKHSLLSLTPHSEKPRCLWCLCHCFHAPF